MASVFGMTDPPSMIDYSINNGRVRIFELCGKTLYNEKTGVEAPGWQQELAKLVTDLGMDKPTEHGKRAFVYWMEDQGII